jgi:predicted transcriptional regulator
MAEADQPDLTTLTVQLLSAYVSNNMVPSNDLAGLIQSTRSALAVSAVPAAEPVAEFPPAVSVRKSLGSREHILSLIDGKPYKSLKRHLSTHGLTPAEYRQRYQLPKDYPMVAPGYSQQRREVAERMGLGRKRAAAKATEAVAPTEQTTPVAAAQKAPAGTRRARKAADVGKSAAETKPAKRVRPARATKTAAAATPPAASIPKSAPKKKAAAASSAKPRTKAKAAVAVPKTNAPAEKQPRTKRASAQRKTKEPALAAG